MRSYDTACVELGVPSLDKAVLAACRREAAPDEILRDLAVLRDDSFNIGVQLMIGLPGQTRGSSLRDIETLARVKGPQSWDLRLYPCLVIDGTELAEMMERGEYRPLSIDEAVDWGGAFLDRALELGFNPIRVGLQESQSLADNVRGGPHHPALGEFIFSKADALRLTRLSRSGPWTVPSRHISKFTGHGGFGLRTLAELSGLPPDEASNKLKFFP